MTTYRHEINNHDAKEETIALMLKHMRGDLSFEAHEKVSRAIEKCESCRRLYRMLTDFFDSSTNVLYEIENKEEIERTDQLFDKLFQLYAPTTLDSTVTATRPYASLSLSEIEEDCLGCGS